METEGGVVCKFSGRIIELGYRGIGMIFPRLDAVEHAAAGVADLLCRCTHALVKPSSDFAAADGVVDEVLIFMNHGAEGPRRIGIIGHITGGGDCRIGINIEDRHSVVADVWGIEEACDIATAAGPTIIDVVIQHMELTVTAGTVGVVAEG